MLSNYVIILSPFEYIARFTSLSLEETKLIAIIN